MWEGENGQETDKEMNKLQAYKTMGCLPQTSRTADKDVVYY